MANVIVINPFEAPKGQESQALAMWDAFAEYFHRQPVMSRPSCIGRLTLMRDFI